MIERREFIKILGMGAAVCLLFQNELFSSETSGAKKPGGLIRTRRILYGNVHNGCSGWNPAETCPFRPRF